MRSRQLLHINSSGRIKDSLTRKISSEVINALTVLETELVVIHRDLSTGIPFIDQQWITANFTEPHEQNQQHEEVLSYSNKLVAEIQSVDYLVIGSPIYNFSIPAVLKAWIDLIARTKLTFAYTRAT